MMAKLLLVTVCLLAAVMGASTSSLSKKEDRGESLKTGRQSRNPSCPVPASCLSKVIAANAVTKKLINFRKQLKQITKKRKIGEKKLNKTLDFNEALLRLKAASGGNISSPVCGGNSSNAGAMAMAEFFKILSNCSENIKALCSKDKFTFNMTQAEKCNASTSVYADFTDKCTDKKLMGSKACDCWLEDGNVSDSAASISSDDCMIKKKSLEATQWLAKCKKALGSCKKTAENATSTIAECNTPTESIAALSEKASLATAEKNKAAAAISAATLTKTEAAAAGSDLKLINTAKFVTSKRKMRQS